MRYLSLIVFLAITFAVAFFGSHFMPDAWFAALQKPSWNPPNWLFAPVWTVLYVLIAVAGWRVWRERSQGWARTALAIWVVQIIANALWTWLFFGQHQILGALADIGLNWITIAAFIGCTWSRDRAAAWMFVPYLAWVSFASALNFAIWQLNH